VPVTDACPTVASTGKDARQQRTCPRVSVSRMHETRPSRHGRPCRCRVPRAAKRRRRWTLCTAQGARCPHVAASCCVLRQASQPGSSAARGPRHGRSGAARRAVHPPGSSARRSLLSLPCTCKSFCSSGCIDGGKCSRRVRTEPSCHHSLASIWTGINSPVLCRSSIPSGRRTRPCPSEKSAWSG
jgi:hypothetical protein